MEETEWNKNMSECQNKLETRNILSLTLSLNILNNFCFHVYAQKSLFIGENANVLGPHQQHPIL